MKYIILPLILGFVLVFSNAFCQPEQPNIIYILADDLGYGDLGSYGSSRNSTPQLDKMAAKGIRFTNFYASSWCLPSRAALMTGCHPHRPGLLKNNSSIIADRITIPEMLKKQGYATALIGKWHLGMSPGKHPLDQGFDYWYGTIGSNDWDGPKPNYTSFRNAPESAWKIPLYINRVQKGIIPQSQFTGNYTKEAIKFIKNNKYKPFFLYLAHNMPHVPVFASEKFKGKSKNGVYGDVIMELDWSIGEVIKAVEKAGISKKTLIVFTSDNGPWEMFNEFGGDSGPLRGEKSTTWDGGQRVPALFYWPKTIAPAVSEALMTNTDVYATLASLTGSVIEKGEAPDSYDMSKVLLSGATSSRTKHMFCFKKPMAYRSGKYKIHFYTRERTRDPETGEEEVSKECTPPLHFNMENDISESKNIAADHPEVVKRLTKEFYQERDAIATWSDE